jgi:hypothetical protein
MRFYRLFKKGATLWSQLIVNSGNISTSTRFVDAVGDWWCGGEWRYTILLCVFFLSNANKTYGTAHSIRIL